MNHTEQILLVVLGIVLTVFLLLLIIVAVYAIKLIRQIRRISARAEKMTMTMETAAELIGKSASPLGFIKVVSGIINQVNKANRKRR